MNPTDSGELGSERFNPSRLRLIRHRRALTASALAADLDVAARTVARWEDGTVAPLTENVAALSVTLDVPKQFFYAPDLDTVPHDIVSFRALSKMSARQRDSATAAGSVALALTAWLDDRFRLPAVDVPTLEGYDPEDAAAVVRERWGLGQAPVSNVLHLLEAHGTRVYSLAGDVASVDAYSFRLDGAPYVFLNTGKTGERRRFDAAHELAHLVLHCGDEVPHGKEAEAQAQAFASAFLMPRDTVLAAGLRQAPVDRILRAKTHWKVSAMALAHRLNELGLMSEWVYRDACVRLSQMGYRRGEPFNPIVPETSQVLAKMFKSLRARGVSAADVAADLLITQDELDQYVFGLVPVALKGGNRRTSQAAAPVLRMVRGARD
ncbi:ImmA/IrrE family metallo-endopeptidase [uncultured Jatrophihabitans sp.]|uniref:ImmA/IrrE family metallo-endopeptidase n=1 Tax=uncultured Jatrophihabitans sp. TaxID=1610747 RepID=UPI0035CA0796